MALGADVRRRQSQGPALQVVKFAREPLRPEAHAGLEFVPQRRNGAHWAGVRSRPRSGGHLRILSFFASEAWNLSHCTCQALRTTNTQPSLQTAETRYAFVGSQHSREHLRAIIQNEWGLDLCSSLPRCSLSVGPLVWPRRRERPGLPAVKPRESMGRAGGRESGLCPCGADGAHLPVRGRRRTSGGRCASTRRKNIASSGSRGPWLGSHALVLRTLVFLPLARCETVAISAGQKIRGKHSRFPAPILFFKESRAATTKDDEARPARS